MTELTMRFERGLTIIVWLKWGRVALVTPFQETTTLSLDDFARAVGMARARRAK